MSTPKASTLRKSAHYKHPPESVWTALTDPRALAEWLMPNTFVPRVGHRFRFQTDPNRFCRIIATECEVLELDPPRRMVWSWEDRPLPGGPVRPPMRIEWTLTPERGGTRLELVQTGERPWWINLAMSFGWSGMLKDKLTKVLGNVRDGAFTPGAVPLEKRFYKARTIPDDLVR